MKTKLSTRQADYLNKVRAITFERCGLDDELDFYSTAISLGSKPADAEKIDAILTVRVMRAKGAL